MGAAENLEIADHDDENSEELLLLQAGDGDGGSKHEDSEGIWLMSYADMMTLLMGFFALMTSMATFEPEEFSNVGDRAAEFFGGEIERPYDELGNELKAMIEERQLGDQVQITIHKTEIDITFTGTLFFESGSVELRDGAILLMNEIVKILEEKADSKKFYIEGHTDDIPIHQGVIASNWELSALRAAAVARLFEQHSFDRNQLMTIGWGETRPLAPNRDEFGSPIKDNQNKNRRVVLKIMDRLPL